MKEQRVTLKNIWTKNPLEGFFRKQVVLQKKPESAYVRIFVDTGYELFINGRFVAAVNEWSNTRDYNVRVFLKEGVNQLAVHGLNRGGHRAMAFELVVDGVTAAVSDKSWKTCGEARWGWMLEDFDDSDWADAMEPDFSAAGALQWWTRPGSDPERVVPTLDCTQFFYGPIPKSCESPYWSAKSVEWKTDERILEMLGKEYKEHFEAQHLPTVLSYKALLHNSADVTEKGVYIAETQRYTGPSFIVDFGGETVGFFRMKIVSKGSLSFRLHYAETLDQAVTEPDRDKGQHRRLWEEYRLFAGTHEFEALMNVGYRYVRVEFFDCNAEVYASDFSVRTTLYPVNRRGYFSCNDEALSKVWEMGERTLHYCMQEYYLDAPMRDRFLWTGDARLEALINYYTFGDTRLFEFCWDELSRTQRPDGSISSAYGEGNSILWDYVAWYVIAYYDYLLYVGNDEFVLKHKENIERAVDFLTSKTGEDGLIDVPANPLGKLWMVELNAYVGKDPYLNRLYLKSLKTAMAVMELAKDREGYEKYQKAYLLTEAGLEKLSVEKNIKDLFDTTEHTQLQYELAEAELEQGDLNGMIARIRKYWCCMISSGSDCLHENTGRTGILPRIDELSGKKVGFGSFCHGWTAAATVLLPKGIAGIMPVENGFRKVEIRPCLDILDSFKCVVPTPVGDIAVKYEKECFEWYVPERIQVTVIIDGSVVAKQNVGKFQQRKGLSL